MTAPAVSAFENNTGQVGTVGCGRFEFKFECPDDAYMFLSAFARIDLIFLYFLFISMMSTGWRSGFGFGGWHPNTVGFE